MLDDVTYGDVRRCPTHGQIISSPDGLIDGLCGECEMLSDRNDEERQEQRPLAPGPICRTCGRSDCATFKYGRCDLAKESDGIPF